MMIMSLQTTQNTETLKFVVYSRSLFQPKKQLIQGRVLDYSYDIDINKLFTIKTNKTSDQFTSCYKSCSFKRNTFVFMSLKEKYSKLKK